MSIITLTLTDNAMKNVIQIEHDDGTTLIDLARVDDITLLPNTTAIQLTTIRFRRFGCELIALHFMNHTKALDALSVVKQALIQNHWL